MAELISGPFHAFVEGKPATQGSKRGIPFKKRGSDGLGVRLIDDNPRTKEWRRHVRDTVRETWDKPSLSCPVFLSCTFWLRRPKSHYGTGRNANKQRDHAPLFPTTKPDSLKLARAVEDALTGLCWIDDSQVVQHTIRKRYAMRGELEGVFIYMQWSETNSILLFDDPEFPK